MRSENQHWSVVFIGSILLGYISPKAFKKNNEIYISINRIFYVL